MVSVNGNRKLIRQNLSACTGKKVTMKDVHNLAIVNKPKASSTDVSELQEIADYLKTQPGIITHYTLDDNNTLTGILDVNYLLSPHDVLLSKFSWFTLAC